MKNLNESFNGKHMALVVETDEEPTPEAKLKHSRLLQFLTNCQNRFWSINPAQINSKIFCL